MTQLQRLFLLSVADCETIQAPQPMIWNCMKYNCEKAGVAVDHDDFCQLWSWAKREGMMHEQPAVFAVSSKGVRALERTKHDQDQTR